ncbi:hypothetical protein ACOMHN_026025 [Nucella lapillus]
MSATTVLPVLSVLLGMMTSHHVVGQHPSIGAWGFGHGTVYGWNQQARALRCDVQVDDGRELRVTVRKHARQAGSVYTALGGSPHLALSPLFTALTGVGGGLGVVGQGGLLDIDIHVRLLRDIPTVYFAFTHFAPHSLDTCPAERLRQILIPSLQGGPDSSLACPGIIASTPVTSGTSQIVKIPQVRGFRLDQLAGRGFAVCNSISYDWDWRPVCSSPVLDVCCRLTYTNGP